MLVQIKECLLVRRMLFPTGLPWKNIFDKGGPGSEGLPVTDLLTMEDHHSWIEISRRALHANIQVFRSLLGPDRRLMCVVKSNAYGHGMIDVSREVLAAGADWLGVFSLDEGVALRDAGINCPVLVLGPAGVPSFRRGLAAELRMTVPSLHHAREFAAVRGIAGKVHLKLETGTHRQGIEEADIEEAISRLMDAGFEVEGAYTHYADIEDTTDHAFAQGQLERFESLLARCRALGAAIPMPHTACTAATILFPETYFAMVRLGIGTFGLWPSRETRVSAQTLGRNRLPLLPVMAWKSRISQIRDIATGDFVGYGRTYRATRAAKIAIVPVGYADGYSRALSNGANTLVRGMRARVAGRICMNLMMIDVTDIPGAAPGDEVILLGAAGDEKVTAEDLAAIAGTINYEIVTRAAPYAPRILV